MNEPMSVKDIVEDRGRKVEPIAYPEHIPGLDPPRIDISAPSPTREVTRLITYRGPGDELDAQLGKSLPDGTRQVRRDTVKITVRTLADTDAQLLESADTCALILRLGAVVRELSASCGKFWRWADLGHMDPQGQVCWCPPCVKKHQEAEADRAELANFADLLRAKAGQMPTGEAPRPVCVLIRPGRRTGYRRTDRAAGNSR